jgi:hypothetical protein
VVEGAPLLRAYGSKAHRGFESLPLRHTERQFSTFSIRLLWRQQRGVRTRDIDNGVRQNRRRRFWTARTRRPKGEGRRPESIPPFKPDGRHSPTSGYVTPADDLRCGGHRSAAARSRSWESGRHGRLPVRYCRSWAPFDKHVGLAIAGNRRRGASCFSSSVQVLAAAAVVTHFSIC